MNWAIYLTTIGLVVTAAGFLHQLLVNKKTATIETLTEKNKWLSEQLELAKANSGNILVDTVTYGTTEQEAKYVMQLQHEGRLEESSEPEETPF